MNAGALKYISNFVYVFTIETTVCNTVYDQTVNIELNAVSVLPIVSLKYDANLTDKGGKKKLKIISFI